MLDLGLINFSCGIFCFGYVGSRFCSTHVQIHCNLCELDRYQSSQSLGLWSAAGRRRSREGLCRNQYSQSLGLWSAAGRRRALRELPHNQLSQSLGLWSAAARRHSLCDLYRNQPSQSLTLVGGRLVR